MSTPPKVYGFSHIGHRAENQDRYKVFDGWDKDQSLLAIVADGMGGHEGGSLAAQTVIDTAAKLWPTRHLYPNPKTFLGDLANLAQNAIIAAGKRSGLDPRTTIVALYVQGNEAVSMHIGDSRVMQFNKQKCLKRTQDHSLAELQRQRGKITEAQMAQHPDQNKLTKSLGQNEEAQPDFETWDIPRNSTFVVCSDGFWGLWDQDQLAPTLQRMQSADALKQAIEAALKTRSGHDNVTAIVLQTSGSGFALPTGDGSGATNWKNPILAFVGFGLCVLVGIYFLLEPLFTAPPSLPRPSARPDTTLEQTSIAPEQIFSQTPTGSAVTTPLPDFESAMSETEKMLENLDQASWEAATREKQQQRAQAAAQQPPPKRPKTTKPIWEPISEPYINARAAAKTVAAHLQSLGILGLEDSLMAKAIDTLSPLDPTPVRVEFSHTHHGILVLNRRVWVDIDNRQMIQIGGRPAQHLAVDKTPQLSFAEAAKKAQALGVEVLVTGARERLVIFRGKAVDHLGWMLEGTRNGGTETLIISAQDGSELFSQRTVSTDTDSTR